MVKFQCPLAYTNTCTKKLERNREVFGESESVLLLWASSFFFSSQFSVFTSAQTAPNILFMYMSFEIGGGDGAPSPHVTVAPKCTFIFFPNG